MTVSLHPSFLLVLRGLSSVMVSIWVVLMCFVCIPTAHCSYLVGWFLLLTFWCFGFLVLFLSFSGTGMYFWQDFAFLFVTVLSSQHSHLCLDLSYTDVTYIFNFLFLICLFLTFLWMHYFSYYSTQRKMLHYIYSFSAVLEILIGYL